ncbi:hypothetical protein HUJ04_009336 [Dendroctonus ponderosae]|nr:hypothetical protein HUJ04_009336 [Dendroctonus ponderosae]
MADFSNIALRYSHPRDKYPSKSEQKRQYTTGHILQLNPKLASKQLLPKKLMVLSARLVFVLWLLFSFLLSSFHPACCFRFAGLMDGCEAHMVPYKDDVWMLAGWSHLENMVGSAVSGAAVGTGAALVIAMTIVVYRYYNLKR